MGNNKKNPFQTRNAFLVGYNASPHLPEVVRTIPCPYSILSLALPNNI